LAVPILLFGSEIWNLKKKENKKTIDTSRDKIFQNNSGYTLFDNERKEEILEELTVYQLART